MSGNVINSAVDFRSGSCEKSMALISFSAVLERPKYIRVDHPPAMLADQNAASRRQGSAARSSLAVEAKEHIFEFVGDVDSKSAEIGLAAPSHRALYCVVDNAVVLTDQDGKPIDADKRHLSPGEDARLVACRMVRVRRRSAAVRGFNDKIAYPKGY
jgi:hypothetical protein